MATSILKSTFRTNLVKSLLFEIISKTSRYHYVFGRKQAWPSVTDPDTGESVSSEFNPPSVSDSFPYELEARNDIIFSKALDANDVAAVIERYDWSANVVYDMYDEYSVDNVSASGATSLATAIFYVVTDEYHVYKCLDNNRGATSTVKPTGTSREPQEYSDGYIWKYMYTIPIYLRNKFMTSSVIPVATSLTTQFYSNGSITNYTIQNRGSDYVRRDSYSVEKLVPVRGGSGYSDGDLTITFPFPPEQAAATIAANVDGTLDQASIVIGNSGHQYNDLSAPLVTISPPDEETGVQATAYATVVNGEVTAITLINVGSGYTQNPLITIEVPPGGVSEGIKVRAVVDAIVIINGVVDRIIMANSGAGYTTPPIPIITGENGSDLEIKPYYFKDTFTDVVVTGDGYIANNPYSINSITIEDGGIFTTRPAGETLITFPNPNIAGTRPVVKVEFGIILDEGITKYTVTDVHIVDPGRGYTSPFYWRTSTAKNNVTSDALTTAPNVESPLILNLNTEAQRNHAQFSPLINNSGEIEALLVNEPGAAYTFATLNIVSKITTETGIKTLGSDIVASNPNFSPATVQTDFNVGSIDSKQSDVELGAIDGAIYACRIITGGNGFSSNTTLTVDGDGTGCELVPTIGPGGAIIDVSVLNPGKNYKSAKVIINGNGSGAEISPIIAPKGGHGKDAIDELYASTLLFSSKLYNEKINNLIPLTSGYRRLAMVKNIREYGSDSIYQNATGTSLITCIVSKNELNIASVSNINILTDQYLYFGDYTNEFLIIEKYETDDAYHLLVLPTNTSYIPIAGSSLSLFRTSEGSYKIDSSSTISNRYNISIASVVPPNINKYSGEMIYLENRTSFSASEDQAVAVSTSIKF